MSNFLLILILLSFVSIFVCIIGFVYSILKKKKKKPFILGIIASIISLISFSIIYPNTLTSEEKNHIKQKEEQRQQKEKQEQIEKEHQEQVKKEEQAKAEQERQKRLAEEAAQKVFDEQAEYEAWVPKQIELLIKKSIYKDDYINVEINENMGRNDGTKMVLVYVKAHGYETYKSALINATKIFKELYTSQLPIGEVCIFFKGDFIDKYGNQSEQTAVKIIMDLNTAQNINWQNFNWRNLPSVINNIYVHPSIDTNS